MTLVNIIQLFMAGAMIGFVTGIVIMFRGHRERRIEHMNAEKEREEEAYVVRGADSQNIEQLINVMTVACEDTHKANELRADLKRHVTETVVAHDTRNLVELTCGHKAVRCQTTDIGDDSVCLKCLCNFMLLKAETTYEEQKEAGFPLEKPSTDPPPETGNRRRRIRL